MKGLFITGNHTKVGKTTVAKQLIHYFKQSYVVKVRKPIESGCRVVDKKLVPLDAQSLSGCADNIEPLSTVCPYRFEAVASPEIAGSLANVRVSLNQLVQACYAHINPEDFVIVEGAGGFYSPIAPSALNADLAVRLNLPVVLVIKDELGAVNQALLTINAVKKHPLKIALLVLNQHSNNCLVNGLNNHLTIEKYSKIPVCLYRDDEAGFGQKVSTYLKF